MNVFRANPYTNTLNYQDDNANSNYNALQIDVRHAFKHGLVMAGNYAWSHTLGTVNQLQRPDRHYHLGNVAFNGHLSYGPTQFDHRQVVNINGSYDLPIGKGRWINLNSRALNAAIGGWTVGTVNTLSSGARSAFTGGRAAFNTTADGGVLFGNGVNGNINSLVNATSGVQSGWVR